MSTWSGDGHFPASCNVIPKAESRSVAAQRQRRSIAEKRRIVEETLVEGASVARVARAHGSER